MTQYITLSEWAARKFAKPPHKNTLNRWATNGSIVPKPFMVGRAYMVTPDARYVNEPQPEKRLAGRMISGLTTA